MDISLQHPENVCKNLLHWKWRYNFSKLSHSLCTEHYLAKSSLSLHQTCLHPTPQQLEINSRVTSIYILWSDNYIIPKCGIPSCLQTTLASMLSHIWSHTVPHSSLRQISTRPSVLLAPPTSLTSPSVQPDKMYNIL